MSGTNPFRRSNLMTKTGTEGKDKRTVLAINTDAVNKSKSKSNKTVRIISPQEDRLSEGSGAGAITSLQHPPVHSPSPDTLASQLDSPDIAPLDPFSVPPDDDQRTPESAVERSDPHLLNQTDFPLVSNVVGNPLKSNYAAVSAPLTDKALPSTPSSQRAHFDVDGFKDLLLTGQSKASSTASARPQVSFGATTLGEAATTSDDRSSHASHWKGTVPLPDRTHTYPSAHFDEDPEEEEIGSRGSILKTPMHHHGAHVKTRGPRIVSFEDPGLSFSDRESSPWNPVDNDSTAREADDDEIKAQSRRSSTEQEPTYKVEMGKEEVSLAQRKVPPAPPPSRRHGQSRPLSYIANTKSSPSIDEEGPPNSEVSNSFDQSSSNKPAPPPPRRHGPIRSNSRSSILSLTSKASSPDSTPLNVNAAQSPPNDSPHASASKRYSAAPATPGSPSMPPPPPPRRRGSSQSSQTPSRFSGDYRNVVAQRARGDSSASSISQLQITPAIETTTQGHGQDRQDPLADLSALQREVDQYRERMAK